MINSTNLKTGSFFLQNGDPYKVLNYDHIKMARGGAVVKIKAKDVLSGAIKDISFSNNDRVEEADIENVNMQYLYNDGENYYFMNNEDFSQHEINAGNIEEEAKYLVEGREFQITVFENKPIAIILTASMKYEVSEAPPAVKGNTATSATKIITLENGLKVDAPQFIKEGDTVKINTTTGQYVSRIN